MISPPNAEKTNTETDAKLHHIIKSRRKNSYAAAASKDKKEKRKNTKNREKNKLLWTISNIYSFPFFLYKKKRNNNIIHAEIIEKRLIFTSIQYNQIKFIMVRKNR